MILRDMRNQAKLSHVAFLVRSANKSAGSPELAPFHKGPAETWEGEGTLEIYIGPDDSTARLLLMEAVADGAYRRAFQKRGPGLHHIAIDVLNLEDYILNLSGSGWFLHPQSLKTMNKTKTAFLARPGIPLLIEVQEQEKLSNKTQFIETVELPLSIETMGIVKCLGASELVLSQDNQFWLRVGSERISGAMISH